jgi:general secretion pathway protein C
MFAGLSHGVVLGGYRLHDNQFMQLNLSRVGWPGLASFVLAGLTAGSAAYWFWLRSTPAVSLPLVSVAEQTAILEDHGLARLLGHQESDSAMVLVPVVNGRFALTGVLAGSAKGGAALISVDGTPAKSFKLGDRVADNLYLQSVSRRSVILADRSDSAKSPIALEMKPVQRLSMGLP